MKIALVSESASPSLTMGDLGAIGQNVVVAGLAAAMANRGHEVTVYTRRESAHAPERVTAADGYTVVQVAAGPAKHLSAGDVFSHTGEFAGYLDAQWDTDPPDVAHAYYWTSGLATQLAARAREVPTVQTFRTLGTVEKRHGAQTANLDARLKLEKLVAKHASWVVATCTDELFELLHVGRSRSRISVVPCGVDVDTFCPDGPVADRGARPRIVAVGKLLPHNGFDTMIKALPNIPDAEYVIVGGAERRRLSRNPEVKRLRALAKELGVADRVVFTGGVAHDEMPAIIRSADVVTCTPLHGSFGLVPLEAMACGIPVVASSVGGMLDTVVDEITGRLVMPQRPRECAEAVTSILRDSFLRRSLGSAGRDRACARYTWDRVAADMCRIYERLITARAEHSPVPTNLGQPTIQSG
ncbi:glycosyltransferase [Mycolicibacterium sp. Dal123E01]|uniref:glycosyltransferase n=1 Tax=Mycolicibacterium sp. Dal123E01 TaxID=3457578 RepID=UPI00403EEEAE